MASGDFVSFVDDFKLNQTLHTKILKSFEILSHEAHRQND